MVGGTLSHFRIIEKVGEGGMGVVYRAEDVKLHRPVAIKVLPPNLFDHPERRLRFLREARAAAAVSHPNIVHVYEVDEADGVIFIAMEYLQGRTLRSLLSRGALPIKQVLDLGVQIADGLARAHQARIIHRDLKPENLVVSADGLAKILDFGLAKLVQEEAGPTLTDLDASAMDTISDEVTRAGKVLGTVAYMSPEQAQGLPVDTRSDLFSFGIMLYEMATGGVPFSGNSSADTLRAIIHRQVNAASSINREVPAELDRIVGKCLEKEPSDRYQDSRDLVVDLRHLRRDTESQAVRRAARGVDEPTQAASSAGPPLTWVARHWRGSVIAVLVLLVAGSVGLASYALLVLAGRGAPFQKMKMARLTSIGNVLPNSAAVSPDGRYVAYVVMDDERQSIWLKQVAAPGSIQIVPPAVVRYGQLSFSRDGDYINYVSGNDLHQVPALGGPPRKVMGGVSPGASFSPDGAQVAFFKKVSDKDQALIVAGVGGGDKTLVTRQAPEHLQNLAWSPDGRVIVFDVGRGPDGLVLHEVRVSDARVEPIRAPEFRWIRGLAWLWDGSGLLVSAMDELSHYQIWLIPYPDGEARRITNDLNDYGALSLSTESSLVTVQSTWVSTIWMSPVGDVSLARQITAGHVDSFPAWTPDGRILYTATEGGLSIMDADGSNQRQLGGPDGGYDPEPSPDGRYVVFVSHRTGTRNIWRMDLDGGNEKQLTNGEDDFAPSCSPDGRWVVYQGQTASGWRLFKVPMDGGERTALTETNAMWPSVSPDGRLVAFRARGSPGPRPDLPTPSRLAVIPFQGGDPIRSFDLPKGFNPSEPSSDIRWATDGSALVYIVRHGRVSNLWRQPLEGGEPVQLTRFESDVIYGFNWGRDDKTLLWARGTGSSDVVAMTSFR